MCFYINAVPYVLTCASPLCTDGVDGKQARRTNSSTPLGELFDHGLDRWACIFFVATVYSIFGRGESGVGVATLYYILWVVLFSFILSHWEKYNTGILFLPWGYDISQVVKTHANTHIQSRPTLTHQPSDDLMCLVSLQTISLVYMVTAVVGVETWYQPALFHFLYRDFFTFMIIGEPRSVEQHTFIHSAVATQRHNNDFVC